MARTSVDWSKYGLKNDDEEKQQNITSVDWSKYEKAQEPFRPVEVPASSFTQPAQKVTLMSSMQDYLKSHPLPKTTEKPKSKGVAAAMAGDLGALLNGVTFGLTKPVTSRFENYIRNENEATKVSPSQVNQKRDEIAKGISQFIGEGVSIGKGYKLAQNAFGRLAPNAGKLARITAPGAIVGAASQAAKEGTDALYGGQDSLRDRGLRVATAGAIGAGGDLLLAGGGKLAKWGADRTGLSDALGRLFKRNGVDLTTDQIAKESSTPLALPAGRVRSGTNVLPKGEEPILAGAGATKARIQQRENPWRDKYNQLIGAAHEMKFTPGRELEELESLWSQMASKEDPNLDELIKLAHPTYFSKVEPGLVQKARSYQQAREVAGAPLPVRASAERLGAPLQVREPEVLASAPEPKPVEAPQIMNEKPAAIDDVADDIELPNPEEVAPRIRDRVNSFADDLINSGKAQLAQSRNRLSSNPVDIYGQYAKIGAGYMLKGTVKLADFTEALVRDFGEEIRPHVKEIFKRSKEQYKVLKKDVETEELGLKGFDAQELKDLSNINLNTGDVYRNFQKVFGKQFAGVKKSVLEPFDEAKGSYATEQKSLTDKLYKEVVKGLGIRKGSKESALVQKFGEGQITLDELKKQAPTKWQNIVKADQWFRREYDGLLDRVNQTVAKIYPNRPEKLVPKRSDYYRHFQELSAWSGLKNLFDTASARISPSLSGISPFTQPKTKWASFKQKRGLGEFKNDAVGGFLDYIPSASYAIHIDPHISVFRNLAKRLAEDTENTANINNFIKFLNNYSNDLAGKTSPFDRWVEELGGRKSLQLLTQANNRVKSNVILGNVRSSLSQLANIPTGIAYGGIDAPIGAVKTVESLFKPNEAMAKSNFLRERYLDKSFRQFNQKWWEQPKRFAEWMMETMDRTGTSFVWNTAYARGVRQKVANPVRFADEETRKLVGGRGVGEQPLLIKSKVFNLVAPFQLEVNNLWRVMKGFVDEKRFGALATLFAANWLLNKAFEKTTGSGVVFDPIDAIYDAATEEDASFLQRAGRIGGEVLSNVPFGQTVAAVYPEYGTNLYGVELPARKELFGDKDPTRFGSGLLVTNAVTDPLFKFVLPFGGNQLKKTTQGIDAMLRGGSYKENVLTTGIKDENPELKFPVKNTPADIVRSSLFGPYATSTGQEYAKKERRPLSEPQTQAYLRSQNPDQFYDRTMQNRSIDTLKRQIDEIRKNTKMSVEERQKQINNILQKIAEINSSAN